MMKLEVAYCFLTSKITSSPCYSSFLFVGSVNGLICFSTGQFANLVVNFLVFNPSIGHFLSIPLPCAPLLHYNVVKGFGFDEKTQDYKILLISGQDGFIYSLNLNRWERICHPLPNNGDWEMKWDSVVYVNGKFHWLVCGPGRRCRCDKLFNFIMVFDVKCESFGRIPLPRSLAKSCTIFNNLTEYGESSIAVSREPGMTEGYVTHVWMMKEYGSVKSWIKLTVGNPQVSWEEFLKHQDQFLGFRNKDEVLIRCANGCIASQKINSNNKRKLELEEEVKKMMDNKCPLLYFSVHKYVPSLVLLDKESNVDVAAPTHTKWIKTV